MMNVGSLVRVRRGIGHVSGGIYAYNSSSLGSQEDDLVFLFTHEDLGLLLEKNFTSTYKDLDYIPIVRILTHHGLGWVPREYIEEVE